MDYSLGRRRGITTATAPLQEVRALRREREDRERIADQQKQQKQIDAEIARQRSSEGSQLAIAQLQGKQSAAEGRRQRAFTADQASKQASRNADRAAFDALIKGKLTPKQASVAGSYTPEIGYRFGDIGAPAILPSAGRGGRGAGGLPKPPDMMKARNELFEQYYDRGIGGQALRDQYESFDDYMTNVSDKYAASQQLPLQQQGAGVPSANAPSSGTITGRGGVLAASRGGQPVDVEQYAKSLLPSAPAQAAPLPVITTSQVTEQPAQVTSLPSPQQQPEFNPMTSDAFAPPQTFAEFTKKRRVKGEAPALPGQERMRSLIEKIERERTLRAGGKRYY